LELTGLPARAVEVDDVRGTGLLAGIDVLPAGDVPSREVARSLLEALVDHGVLAGLTGPGGDVLKVRPPLVWETEHADEFVTRLGDVVRAHGR
jgi:4-aminobutyrate aminotransferase-like enzyme